MALLGFGVCFDVPPVFQETARASQVPFPPLAFWGLQPLGLLLTFQLPRDRHIQVLDLPSSQLHF